MHIVEESFQRLYPDKSYCYEGRIKYTDHFSAFNANVKKRGSILIFGLSRKWKEVDREIKIGLLQELLGKILKDRRKSINIDLYNNFVKTLHLSAEKEAGEPLLEDSFRRVNERYFYGMIEKPNLVFKGDSRRRLATYAYHTDTVSVSTKFRNAPEEIIDYLVYHELLHKKLKFKSSVERTVHHSPQFRRMEREFENSSEIEKQIQQWLRWR